MMRYLQNNPYKCIPKQGTLLLDGFSENLCFLKYSISALSDGMVIFSATDAKIESGRT